MNPDTKFPPETLEECELLIVELKELRKKLKIDDYVARGVLLDVANVPLEGRGRPLVDVSMEKIVDLRMKGRSYSRIAKDLKIGVATLYRRLSPEAKVLLKINNGKRFIRRVRIGELRSGGLIEKDDNDKDGED
jgi:DNA invertase Pin-like site-specific DNA recombinase